ncbi:MAG: glycosyltransferase family 9 protein [Burkholderiales bacterium]|nr:glycosyltransferase family 9 protein [Burkholderiales bacterium]
MKILLVRPDGIGDQVLCLPVASALRRQLPDAHITFLSSVFTAPVLLGHPDLDAVITVTGAERFRERVALFRQGFDAAIFLKPFRPLIIAAWAARVPIRVATGYRWYSAFVNRRVYEHRHDFSKHESEYNLGLLKGIGLIPGPVSGQSLRPVLAVSDEERQAARALLEGMPTPLIVVHPGGFSTRRWRSEHYWDLVLRLLPEGYGVVLTGSADEGRRFSAEAPASQVPRTGLLNLMGRVTLRELMAVIAASKLLVSGSTGPAHLAAALGRPVVSLFDPRRNALPIRWQPLGEGIVLRPDVPTCEKCIGAACPYWDCLDRITVNHVLAQARQVVALAKPVEVLHI